MNRKDEIKKMEIIIRDADIKCGYTECEECEQRGQVPCLSHLEAAALYDEGYRQVVSRGPGALVNLLNEEQKELKKALENLEECKMVRVIPEEAFNETLNSVFESGKRVGDETARDDIEAATRRQMAKEILNATTIHGRRYIRKYLKERYGL